MLLDLDTLCFTGSTETKSSGLFGGMTLQPQQPLTQPATISQPPASQVANSDFADSFGLLSLDTQPPTQVCLEHFIYISGSLCSKFQHGTNNFVLQLNSNTLLQHVPLNWVSHASIVQY